MTDLLPLLVDDYIKKKYSRSRVRAKRKKGKIVPAKGKTDWGRIYEDGREVCSKSTAGQIEYWTRKTAMAVRQGWKCWICGELMVDSPGFQLSVTFGHDIPRGMGGALRDDRIEIDGKPVNHAECWGCNGAKGSKRLSKVE